MKQSGLFPPALVLLMAIVIISASQLTMTEVSWGGINSPGNGYYNSLHRWGDYPLVKMSGLDEFDTFKILLATDSVNLLWDPDKIHGQNPSRYIIYETFYTMPDELLTLQINSQPLIPKQPSEWENDVRPASEPADHIVFNNNVDYIESMRIPAPTSLLLLAIGLLSLRYTRSLRL